jgi:succinoglycan biosynthesis protein ExoM
MLQTLLEHLCDQQTDGLFTYSIVVVDNDSGKSAERTVSEIINGSGINMHYATEPRQGISHARNKSVALAKGNYIAFIDDDEIPSPNWLLTLYSAMDTYNADGIVGPVVPMFESPPPEWLSRGRLYFWRFKNLATGDLMNTGATGNSLIKKSLTQIETPPFNIVFNLSGGEDSIFFSNIINKGYRIVFCKEAEVQEFVETKRMSLKYLLKRNVLEGKNTMRRFRILGNMLYRLQWFLKSLVGICTYSIIILLFVLIKRHIANKYMLKTFYFLGVLFEFLNISSINKRSDIGEF